MIVETPPKNLRISKSLIDDLERKGYFIEPDVDQPGQFVFYNKREGEGCEQSFGSYKEAVIAALTHSRRGLVHHDSVGPTP